MAEKPPKKDPPKVEEKWVTWSDLEAGVHIKKAGHPVILFIGGHAPPGTDTTDDPDSTTTAGPATTTTAGPGDTTTAASPSNTTTSGGDGTGPGENTTQPPGETTSGPAATTTAAPASPATTTTAPGDGTGPGEHTTEPPGETTSKAPDALTTAGPPTTTSAASHPTTAPPTTTTAPSANTTHAPPTTTTHAPPATTTHAPQTTTTHAPPATTTHAPPTTTTLGKTTRKTTLGDEYFETAKSFPLPGGDAIATFQKIAALANKETNRQLLILGHTDTAGPKPDATCDAYNLTLSDERAASIKAYLLNDVDSWLPWYDNADPQKQWGTREDQYMLQTLPYGGGDKFYTGEIDGIAGPAFTAAVQKFQTSAGLDADGSAGPDTHRALILQYMQAEGTSVPPGTTIETKGCGLRHLAVPTPMYTHKPENRRVEVYAFVGAITPAPSAWDPNDKKTNQPAYDAWHATVLGDFD